jgi:hypothetical protein
VTTKASFQRDQRAGARAGAGRDGPKMPWGSAHCLLTRELAKTEKAPHRRPPATGPFCTCQFFGGRAHRSCQSLKPPPKPVTALGETSSPGGRQGRSGVRREGILRGPGLELLCRGGLPPLHTNRPLRECTSRGWRSSRRCPWPLRGICGAPPASRWAPPERPGGPTPGTPGPPTWPRTRCP